MNEKDLLQKIKYDAENIIPPSSLSPEAVEQMLHNTQKQAGSHSNPEAMDTDNTSEGDAASDMKAQNNISSIDDRKKKSSRRILRYGSLAAVVAVAFTAFWQYQHTLIQPQPKSEITYSVTPETEQIAPTKESGNKEQSTLADNLSGEEKMNVTEDSSSKKESAVAEDSIVKEEDSIAEDSVVKDKSGISEDSAENEEVAIAQDSAEDTTASEGSDSESTPITEQFTYAQSYEDIYKALQDYTNSANEKASTLYGTDAMAEQEIIMEDAAADYSTTGSISRSEDTGADAADFSETNLQEQGVDEGDIVKTDGKYIYILRQDLSMAIFRADGKDSEVVSITSLATANDASIQEMYLDGDIINIILSEYTSSLEQEDDFYYTNSHWQTRILTYDISDRSQPVQTGDMAQDGYYRQSRKNGAYLYLFTQYTPDIQDTYEDSTIVPRLGGSQALASDFYIPENLRDCDYLVISSMDVSNPGEILDSKVLVSGVSTFYVSTENIYIANETYDSSQTRTEIIKFHYAEGQITGMAAGSVKGYLNDSFSMNEYEGNLRVVSTYYGDDYNNVRDIISDLTGTYFDQNWTEHNALYVLDESLQQIGAIEGLAEEETIRSARFFGDIGYFVTFRQTDPLFSVDLSDPENPRILGELKISGFSSYLHFYGENLLLGIGYEADEETGITSGLKLSMFDISDPANVTEVNRLVIPGITWCPAIEDYKAILVEPEKNLIGFYCDNRYMVFSYDGKNGFTRELLYDFYSDMLGNEADYSTMRGLYINDDFYLAGNTFLLSFDMENGFEKEGLLTVGK